MTSLFVAFLLLIIHCVAAHGKWDNLGLFQPSWSCKYFIGIRWWYIVVNLVKASSDSTHIFLHLNVTIIHLSMFSFLITFYDTKQEHTVQIIESLTCQLLIKLLKSFKLVSITKLSNQIFLFSLNSAFNLTGINIDSSFSLIHQ